MKIITFLILCLLSTSTFATDINAVKEISTSLTAIKEAIKNATEPTQNSKTCIAQVIPETKIDLLKEIKFFSKTLKENKLNSTNCALTLHKMYDDLYRITPAQFNQEKLKKDANAIMDEIFTAKLTLRKNLENMEKSGDVNPECVSSVRDIFRASIFLSEFIGEHFTKVPTNELVFQGGSTALSINPEFGKNLELKSGDILVSRGNAFVSGAIARIGDSDGNFSHVALVYIDPETKKAYTVEAHIEVGVVVAPIEKYLGDGKARSTVFRQKDEKLAAEAAKKMFERAKKASDSGHNIPYDFGMLLEGKDKKSSTADTELFCSEVAYEGYKEASGGKFVLPKYPTGMHMKNPAFKNALGIKTNETFAPSDMEVDTRFAVVAEWRNLQKTEKSRMTDAIITKMYDYMEKDRYVLKNTTADAIKRDLVYVGRHLPLFSSLLKDKLPTNMTRSTLGTMIAMDKTAEPILEKLTTANNEQKSKTGYAFTAKEMAAYIDQLTEDDKKTYKTYEAYKKQRAINVFDEKQDDAPTAPPKPLFHTTFHAK
jgi:hypothetical protein